jgi:hypothetical protein
MIDDMTEIRKDIMKGGMTGGTISAKKGGVKDVTTDRVTGAMISIRSQCNIKGKVRGKVKVR